MAAHVTDGMAETLEEANAQMLTIPIFEGWFRFAHTLSGYNIFARLRRADSIGDLRHKHTRTYYETGRWEGSLLELRLVLFMEARAQRHGAYPGYHPDEDPKFRAMMTDLLDAIRTRARAEGRLAEDPGEPR
jgi:hypothetical protein